MGITIVNAGWTHNGSFEYGGTHENPRCNLFQDHGAGVLIKHHRIPLLYLQSFDAVGRTRHHFHLALRLETTGSLQHTFNRTPSKGRELNGNGSLLFRFFFVFRLAKLPTGTAEGQKQYKTSPKA